MGGHGDKLTGDLHIQPLHLIQVSQILLQNGRNGDILDLYFIFTEEQKDNIQRTFEILHLLGTGMNDTLQAILRLCHVDSFKIQYIQFIIPPFFSLCKYFLIKYTDYCIWAENVIELDKRPHRRDYIWRKSNLVSVSWSVC